MQSTFTALLAPNMYSVSVVLFRFLLSTILVIVGLVVAKRLTAFIRRSLTRLFSQEKISSSPLGVVSESLQNIQGSGVFSMVVYWVIVLFFLSVAGEILGITLLSSIMALVLGYVPALISAMIVFILGAMVSGVLEKIVKKQMKTVAPQQAVLAGTFTSYAVVSIFGLIALSELGIASNFILVLFAGMVFAIALALGLALGFGAKDLVSDMLKNMVQDEQNRRGKR